MPDIPALTFGVFLVGLGIVFLRSHWLTWQRRQDDPEGAAKSLHFHRSQFRRRMQTSALIIAIGVLIPVGDALFVHFPNRMVFGLYWFGVLVLVGWVVVLAMADLVAGRVYTHNAMQDVEERKRALEREVNSLREELRISDRNGRS